MKRTKDRFKTFKITPCSSSHQHISSSSRNSSTSLFLSLALDSVFPEIQDNQNQRPFIAQNPQPTKPSRPKLWNASTKLACLIALQPIIQNNKPLLLDYSTNTTFATSRPSSSSSEDDDCLQTTSPAATNHSSARAASSSSSCPCSAARGGKGGSLFWGGFVLCVFYLLILAVGLVGLSVLQEEDFGKCARRTKTTKNEGQNTHQEDLSLSLSVTVASD